MAIPILNNLDLSNNQLLNALLQHVAGNHGAPLEGMIWWDTSAKAIKYFDGTTVVTLGAAGGGGDADTLDGQDSTFYLNRANHTGTQLAASISDFETAVNALLGPYATDQDVTNAINSVIDAAPGALDTLNELAAALGDDPNFATTVNNALAERPRKFAATVGDGASTAITVAHNLGTLDVSVEVYRNAAPRATVLCDVERPDANSVTLRFATAPATGSLRVLVRG